MEAITLRRRWRVVHALQAYRHHLQVERVHVKDALQAHARDDDDLGGIAVAVIERACEELEYLLTDERWRTVGPGYTKINVFLRTVDFSPFNVGEKHPELVRLVKALQPGASNRAIASAIGVSRVECPRIMSTDLDVLSCKITDTIGGSSH